MEAIQSWAIALTVGGGIAYYYWSTSQASQPQQTRARSGLATEASRTQLKKQDTKPQRKSDTAAASELSLADATVASAVSSALSNGDSSATEAGQRKKKPGQAKPKPKQSAAGAAASRSVPITVSEPEPSGDDNENKAWAEQMANVRKGTNLAPPTKQGNRTKTVKANTADSTQAFSSASSTGGIDADDDSSPGASPSLRAGDVSDMLEPSKSGPSILRLTEPSNPTPNRAPQPKKEFQAAETKKQRQNREKNEARKTAIQEQEKERQILLEKQRRTAREARGEPARNGLQQSQAPSTSAWTSKSASLSETEPKSGGAPHVQPLLDTFERAEPPAIGNAQASVVPTNSTHEASSLSEQAQLDLATKLSEDESGWNTVATGKKGKKPVQAASPPEESKPANQVKPVKPTAPVVAPKVTNGFASLDDSDWAA